MATIEERIEARLARRRTWVRVALGFALAGVAFVAGSMGFTILAGGTTAQPTLSGLMGLLGGGSCLLAPFLGLGFLVALLLGRNVGAEIAWLKRVLAMMRRHGCDEATALRILRRDVWEGMAEAMLLDARGYPLAKDEKRVKGQVRETWKYHQTGRGRFATRIFVEHGVVVGWDVKR